MNGAVGGHERCQAKNMFQVGSRVQLLKMLLHNQINRAQAKNLPLPLELTVQKSVALIKQFSRAGALQKHGSQGGCD